MKQATTKLIRGFQGWLINHVDRTPELPVGLKGETIGKTVNGQSITAYKVGKGKRHVLIVGGTHANEVGAIKLSYHLLTWLNNNNARFPNLSFTIIPCLNVDSYQTALVHPDYLNGGRIGRFNSHNVDLNRNFPTKSWQSETVWKHGYHYQEQTVVQAGEQPGSEPEMKALLNYIKNNPVIAYYALHCAGADVMGNNTDLSQQLVKSFAKISHFRYFSEKEWQELGETGTAKEWCDENKIAYIEIEGSNRWSSDWSVQKEALLETFHLLDNFIG